MPSTAAQQALNTVTARREPHGMRQALGDAPLLAAVEKTHQRLNLLNTKLRKEQDSFDVCGNGKETVAQERPQLAQKGGVDGNGRFVAARHVQGQIARAVVVQHFQAHVDKSALAFEHLHGGGGGANARFFAARLIHVKITDKAITDTITWLCTLASRLSLCGLRCLPEHIFFFTVDFKLSLFVHRQLSNN
jgi:hypothetical protein